MIQIEPKQALNIQREKRITFNDSPAAIVQTERQINYKNHQMIVETQDNMIIAKASSIEMSIHQGTVIQVANNSDKLNQKDPEQSADKIGQMKKVEVTQVTVKVNRIEFEVYQGKKKFQDLPPKERTKRIHWLRIVFSHVSGLFLLQFCIVLITINPGTHLFFGGLESFGPILIVGIILMSLIRRMNWDTNQYILNYAIVICFMFCQADFFAFIGCISGGPLYTICITTEMAAFSIGMTVYIWIVKENYSFITVFCTGFAADLIVMLIFGCAWDWGGSVIMTLVTLILFAFFFYESYRIIDNIGIQYNYNEIIYPVVVLFSSCIMVIVLLVIICFRVYIFHWFISLCCWSCCLVTAITNQEAN